MRTSALQTPSVLNLRAGDLVEVRDRAEILLTLDPTGKLDALPFMPEMLKYCGQRLRVYKRADKTCDTIFKTGSRRMRHTVHLEGVRCDGIAHGNCQALCLLFWKEEWLKRVTTDSPEGLAIGFPSDTPTNQMRTTNAATPEDDDNVLTRAARDPRDASTPDCEVYSCQATELFKATEYLAWWDVRQYVRDVTSGNVALVALVPLMLRMMYNVLLSRLKRIRGGYRVATTISKVTHGVWVFPAVQGTLTRTPSMTLNLQPGEYVQVKSREEILTTLDTNQKNRGLYFDVEMLRYCGRTFRVLQRVERIINETNGRLMRLPNDCVILEGVTCSSHFSEGRLFCPRSIYPYWREIWLRRITPSQSVKTATSSGS